VVIRVGLTLAMSTWLSSSPPLVAPIASGAHPMHSTLTEVVEDRARGTVRATIRVFADDLGVALARATHAAVASSGPAWDSTAVRYAKSVLALRDARGRALALHACGIRRAAGVVWLCLETDRLSSTESWQLRNSILCELYDDQVNVVQGIFGGERRSLLFVRGDGFKPLR
jgi:hypothetical protein